MIDAKLDFISISTDDEVELTKLYADYGLYVDGGFNRTGHAEQFCEVMEKPALNDLVVEIIYKGSKCFLGVYHIVSKVPKEFKYEDKCINKKYIQITLFRYDGKDYQKISSGYSGIAENGGLVTYFDHERKGQLNIIENNKPAVVRFDSEYHEDVLNDMFNAFIVLNLVMLDDSSKNYISKDKTVKMKVLSQLKGNRNPSKVRVNVFNAKEYIQFKNTEIVENTKITENTEITETQNTKEKIWHCPAWGVRGHYRHCPSGKITYVKPHVKGQKRDEYKGREYQLKIN